MAPPLSRRGRDPRLYLHRRHYIGPDRPPGLEATIHWNYAKSLSKHYPGLKVNPDRALVVTGRDRTHRHGGAAVPLHLDLSLYLVARFVGLTEALEVANTYLIQWHDAGQRPFSALLPGKQTSDGLIAKCQEWAGENYAEPAPVTSMVRLSGLAERTFVRRFTRATRMSPLDYLHALRDWKRPSRSWRHRTYRWRQWHWKSVTRTTDSSAACSVVGSG